MLGRVARRYLTMRKSSAKVPLLLSRPSLPPDALFLDLLLVSAASDALI